MADQLWKELENILEKTEYEEQLNLLYDARGREDWERAHDILVEIVKGIITGRDEHTRVTDELIKNYDELIKHYQKQEVRHEEYIKSLEKLYNKHIRSLTKMYKKYIAILTEMILKGGDSY